MSGWNLPPGCTLRDIENAFGGDGPCEVCGKDEYDCICPECPDCGAAGDIRCYRAGHLEFSEEQLKARADDLKEQEAERKREDQYWADLQQEEALAKEYWRDN